MAAKPHDPGERKRNLMDALAESVAEAPDEEILDEARERGEDTSARADRVRSVLRRAVDDHDTHARASDARQSRRVN
jgi:hypothetical protein